jgi:type II secretory pathway pseudopilin PulG
MINLQTKKAAMFGLDARIALAIFGALSVISGAALYSAIQSANAEAWRQYFENVIKASEQYYLDNGQQTPIYNTTGLYTYAADLAINREGLSTWRGPYLSTTSGTSITNIQDSMTLKISPTSGTQIFLRDASTWTEMNDDTNDEKCVVNSPDCSEWITVRSGGAHLTSDLIALFNSLDSFIDNGDGELSGKVRYSSGWNGYIMYQGTPRIRRN